MERCPWCGKVFWPWSGGLIHKAKLYHVQCYNVAERLHLLDVELEMAFSILEDIYNHMTYKKNQEGRWKIGK